MKADPRRVLLPTVLCLLLAACNSGEPTEVRPKTNGDAERVQREVMVAGIRADEVKDERVLAAMLEVPRHLFVPKQVRSRAYDLTPLRIGEGQTISDPRIVGLMTELLELDGSEKVLEIGTGSGYQAAVLSKLVPKVWTIEIRKGLAESARARLKELGYDNVVVRCGDGYKGWPEEAPFDAIIVTAAPPEVPEALVEQLAPGGRMVVPVGPQTQNQMLLEIVKDEKGRVTRHERAPVWFVPMVHEKE